jgi:PAS domain S-box-containing protein
MLKQKNIIPPEYAALPYFILTIKGFITNVHTAAATITGIPQHKLIAADFTTLFTEPLSAGKMLQQAITQKKAENYKLCLLPGSRERKTCVLFSAYCSGRRGLAEEIIAVITSTKKAGSTSIQKIQKEINDYKYALDESSIVAITDQKGVIKYANHNFCKISRFSYSELIGQDHRIINSGYHPKEFIRNLWTTIANGKIWRGELKNRAKDGTHYWVDTTIVPFLNEQGKPYQYVAIRADITQRKHAEEELMKLNEELEKRVKERTEEMESFSYSVSHDLRAPLRAVNGYAKILEEDYKDIFDAEGRRLLKEVQENAKKMGALIDDLLTFSRLGRKEVERSVIDMTELAGLAIKEVSQSVQHRAEIKLCPLLPAKADAALLQNVLINLISNAVKYSDKKEKPVIEIRSERGNGMFIYSVSDNGVGFDMQYANKLFGVFQRLHSADEFPGTGVGLAMSKRIISKHGGQIWGEGKLNNGATFYFTLPEN